MTGARSTTPSESDRVGYPLGADTRIEGGRNSGGDMHAIVVEQRHLPALRDLEHPRVERPLARRLRRHLVAEVQRPAPGHLDLRRRGRPADPARPAALERGEGRARCSHAIRFTTDVTSSHHLWPARHDAGSQDSLAYPPMGARFRLKASLSALTGYGTYARTGDHAR